MVNARHNLTGLQEVGREQTRSAAAASCSSTPLCHEAGETEQGLDNRLSWFVIPNVLILVVNHPNPCVDFDDAGGESVDVDPAGAAPR